MIKMLTPTRKGIGPSEESTLQVLANTIFFVSLSVWSYLLSDVEALLFGITIIGIVFSVIWGLESLNRILNRYHTHHYE